MPLWLKIVIGIFAGLGALIAGVAGLVFWLTLGLVEPIERQLTALKAGDMKAAYEETSEAFRQATPIDAFTTFVDSYPILKDAASHSFPSRSFENNQGTVTGTLTSPTGGVTPATYELVKENGAWKIIHIKLDPVTDNTI